MGGDENEGNVTTLTVRGVMLPCPFHKVHPVLSKQRQRSIRLARRVSGSEGHHAEAGLLYADLSATGEGHRKEPSVRT